MWAKIAEQRAEIRRLRKQIFRQSVASSKDEKFRAAVKVDNFALPLPQSEAQCIFSTKSIAAENMVQAERMCRASSIVVPERSGGSEAPCDVEGEMSTGDQDDESQPARTGKRGRSQYSNIATSTVWIEMPGPVRKRIEASCSRGIAIAEAVLSARLMTYFENFISVRTLSKAMSQELENAAQDVRAHFVPRKGCDSRRLMDTKDKPINLTGRMCRATLSQAIYASYLGLDLVIRQKGWTRNCSIISINVDGSAFDDKDQLGIVLHFTFIEDDGADAMGNKRHKATTRSVCTNSLPIADKISKDVRRNDGSLFQKEVPTRIVQALAMSGHLFDVIDHDCVVFDFDKGPETRGGGKGIKGAMRRDAFFGRGSPLEQIFGTREAIDGAMNGETAPFLRRCMDFLGIPPSQQFLGGFNARQMPEQLDVDPTRPVPSLPFNLTVLHRRWDPASKQYMIEKKIVEHCSSRPSTKLNPMAHFPCIKGGSAIGKWCDKHALNRAGAAYTNDKRIKRMMKLSIMISSQLRKIQTHTALKHNIGRILCLKGALRPQPCHDAIRNALGEKLVKQFREKYPLGLPRAEKGVGSRWNSIQQAVYDQDERRRLIAAVFPIALAHGEDDSKTKVGELVCTKDGFGSDQKTIVFSPDLGRCFFHMNSPSYILHLAVAALIHVLSFKPLLAACADRGEHAALALGSVNSILTTVDWVLRRGLFVVPSHAARQLNENCRWYLRRKRGQLDPKPVAASAGKWTLTHRLRHRGPPSIESNGRTLLSTQLERIPKESTSQEPPALLHLYGKFYQHSMADAVSRARDTMVAVCRMKGLGDDDTVIPREYLPDFKGQQRTYAERIEAAQWFLKEETRRAADCILKKLYPLLTGPIAFLAGLYDVVHVPVRRAFDEFSYGDSDDFDIIDIASDKAISCANILLVQLKELLSLHGPTLWDFVQDPLRRLLKDQMPSLERFAQRSETDFARLGMTVVPGFERFAGYPKSITNFPALAELAMMAAAFITNTNPVESRWSLLTGRHHANVRHVGSEYMSAAFRQKDFRTTGLLSLLRLSEFQSILASAREFRNQNREGYNRIFRINFEESQDKENRRKRPQRQYAISNIAENLKKPNKKDVQAEKRIKIDKNRKRGSGAIASRHHSDSEGDESAESEESSDDFNGEDAAPDLSEGNDDEEAEDIIEDDEAAGSFNEVARCLGVNGHGSSPSSDSTDHASNKSAGAGHCVQGEASNDNAHLAKNPDEELNSARAFYTTQRIADLKDMCITREITVKPSVGNRCKKEDFVNALLADDATCRALPQPPSPVAHSSEAHSAVAGPPQYSGLCNLEAPVPSEEIQSEPLSSQMAQPRQDNDDSAGEDRSDVGSDFDSDNGWDEDEPLFTRRSRNSKASSDSVASASGILVDIPHPLPNAQDVSDQQARDRPWKIDSVRCMLQKKEWKDTVVDYMLRGKRLQKNSVVLTRLDGKRFPLRKSAHLLYVVYTDNGLELAHPEEISYKSVGARRNAVNKVFLTYSRVLHTAKAIEQCASDKDHHSTVRNGIHRVSSLGAKSLQKLLEKIKDKDNCRLVFHRGDFPYETSAENVVGFVAWQSWCDGVNGAGSNNDAKSFLTQINSSLRIDSSPTELKLASLSEIDVVYLGPDFSEPAED